MKLPGTIGENELRKALDSLSTRYGDQYQAQVAKGKLQAAYRIMLKKEIVAELRWELFGHV